MGVLHQFESGVPHPLLRPYIDGYSGYRIRGGTPGVHAGLPSKTLTFIVSFDDPLDVDGGFVERDRYWAMLAGLHARPTVVHHDGNQHGVQLGVTPAGAAALFGVPAGALAHQVVHLDAVIPDVADVLVERLAEASTWHARFAILDEVLMARLSPAEALPAELSHAWETLVRCRGTIRMDALADAVGWSRPHLSRRFTSAFGVSPKLMARVIRFEHAQQLMRQGNPSSAIPSLANVAAACGYADQAHMTRDFHEFAGGSPTMWMADELVPFVQDA